jgi:integrase
MVAISGTSQPASAKRVAADPRNPSSVHPVSLLVVRITVATRGAASSAALSGAPTRVLQRILSVAKDRGKIKTNPCERGGRLYEADRSDKLWTDDIIKQFFEGAPKHLHLPLMLALWTGQRRSDLLRLPRSAYNGERIRLRRKKGKRGGAPRHDTPQPPQSRLLINDTIYCPWDEMTR